MELALVVEIVVFLAAAAGAAWLLVCAKAGLESEGQQFARFYLMWVSPEHVPELDEAHRRDRRLRSAGPAASIVCYGLARTTWPPSDALLAAALVLFAALCSARRVELGSDDSSRPGSRSLRGSAGRVHDYLPWYQVFLIVALPVAAFWGAAAGLVAVANEVGRAHDAWVVIGAGLAIGVVGSVNLGLALTGCRGDRSTRTSLDYLRDAWRTESLRRPVFAQGIATSWLWLQVDQLTWSDPTPWLGGWRILPFVVGVAGVALAGVGRLHFRSRLWPELGAGEWVGVGGPVPGTGAASA